ncbi:MAG: hypothetical protein IT546_12945 [Caulobacteraceae bacterium]|nr:hypothetical protein [Caulobacteraceae bacterium]
MGCYRLYEPINVLKPVAEDVWVVDGPEIRMDYALGLTFGFPTRATIVRLPQGLWVHSPTPLTPELGAQVDALGPARWLSAPNTIHYWWVADWKARYPQARAYAAPGVRRRSRERFTAWDEDLGDAPPAAWAGQIDQALAPGGLVSEVLFHHRPSRTAILTDLIENFQPERTTCLGWRLLTRWGGCADPNGSAPYDMRLNYLSRRAEVRAAVRRMLDASPQRAVLAHGRWYEANAEAELARAFRWALR